MQNRESESEMNTQIIQLARNPQNKSIVATLVFSAICTAPYKTVQKVYLLLNKSSIFSRTRCEKTKINKNLKKATEHKLNF